MAEKEQSTELNVFIEFQIIKDSQPDLLSKEFDILIASGKRIHVWSKTEPEEIMKKFCSGIVIETPESERELHKKIFILRHKERKTFAEISNLLNVPIDKVSYFSKADPLREWTLDNWIWSYERKDPMFYSKVDYLVDSDEKLVQRFKRAGRKANLIKKV